MGGVGLSRRRFGWLLSAIWAAAALGPLLGIFVLQAASFPEDGGAGAMGIASMILLLTQVGLGLPVAAALALVTAARLRALGWPRMLWVLGAVPAVLNLVAFAVWPPLALAMLPLGPPNGLGFGIAIALWLAPES